MDTKKKIKKNKTEVMNFLNEFKGETIKIDRVINETNLNQIEALKSLLYLEGEEKVEIKEKTIKEPEITKKGEKNLKNKFPIEKALQKLENKEIKIKKFYKQFKKPNQLIGELKQKNLAKIKNKNKYKTIKLTKKGKKQLKNRTNKRKIMKKIHNSKTKKSELNQKEYKNLKKRNLIKENKKIIRYIKIKNSRQNS